MSTRGPWQFVTRARRRRSGTGHVWVLTLACGHVMRRRGRRTANVRARCVACYRIAEAEVERIRAKLSAALDAGIDDPLRGIL